MAFPLAALLPVVGRVLDRVLPEDPEKRREAERAILELHQAGELKELDAAMQVVVAEAQSEHPITSQWRPITMLTFVTIIANNYLLAPYLQAMFGWSVTLDMPEQMWDLLTVGLGGYVVGRSAEKFAKNWKG